MAELDIVLNFAEGLCYLRRPIEGPGRAWDNRSVVGTGRGTNP
jgi:hypothetical protein